MKKTKVLFDSLAFEYKLIENKEAHNEVMQVLYKIFRFDDLRYKILCVEDTENNDIEYKEILKKYSNDYDKNICEKDFYNSLGFINNKIKISDIVNSFIDDISDEDIIKKSKNFLIEIKNIVYCSADID